MKPTPITRTPFVALTVAAIGLALAGGCSSSSSGGAHSALAARSVPSETFHNVTPRANHILQRSLALMRGVASNTYQGSELTVTFRSTATKLDQHNVENVVRQAQQQAAAASKKPAHHTKKSGG